MTEKKRGWSVGRASADGGGQEGGEKTRDS